MNLKEAFRYQKFYDSLLSSGERILRNESYITTTTETHLLSKVKPGAVDVTTVSADNLYKDKINTIIDLMLVLLGEKEKLYKAITEAKKTLSLDMDSAIAVNIKRQSLISIFGEMAKLQSNERIRRGMGTGYTFNAEGNQVQYKCDLKTVTSICFDRNKVRSEARRLSEASDLTSASIDKAIVTTNVEYTSPFNVNDTFDEVLEAFTTL